MSLNHKKRASVSPLSGSPCSQNPGVFPGLYEVVLYFYILSFPWQGEVKGRCSLKEEEIPQRGVPSLYFCHERILTKREQMLLLTLINKKELLIGSIMGEIFKKQARIRKAAQRGMEITIPPETPFEAGDEVTQLYDGFVLVVPKGVKVDEQLLIQAIVAEE